jgi:hypothetical protein
MVESVADQGGKSPDLKSETGMKITATDHKILEALTGTFALKLSLPETPLETREVEVISTSSQGEEVGNFDNLVKELDKGDHKPNIFMQFFTMIKALTQGKSYKIEIAKQGLKKITNKADFLKAAFQFIGSPENEGTIFSNTKHLLELCKDNVTSETELKAIVEGLRDMGEKIPIKDLIPLVQMLPALLKPESGENLKEALKDSLTAEIEKRENTPKNHAIDAVLKMEEVRMTYPSYRLNCQTKDGIREYIDKFAKCGEAIAGCTKEELSPKEVQDHLAEMFSGLIFDVQFAKQTLEPEDALKYAKTVLTFFSYQTKSSSENPEDKIKVGEVENTQKTHVADTLRRFLGCLNNMLGDSSKVNGVDLEKVRELLKICESLKSEHGVNLGLEFKTCENFLKKIQNLGGEINK